MAELRGEEEGFEAWRSLADSFDMIETGNVEITDL